MNHRLRRRHRYLVALVAAGVLLAASARRQPAAAMSLSYRVVGWNANKARYDQVAIGTAVASAAVVAGVLALRAPALTIETVLIRALGVTAFALLHVVLAIGPLVRLDRRLLPLLYNRRHLGVLTFTFGLAHGLFALIQFHTGGTLDPLVSLLAGEPRLTDRGLEASAAFPFQPLGAAALGILFVMAATSHDFWLHNLSPYVWKSLHMGVYVAYGLLVLHVLLGVRAGPDRPGDRLGAGRCGRDAAGAARRGGA